MASTSDSCLDKSLAQDNEYGPTDRSRKPDRWTRETNLGRRVGSGHGHNRRGSGTGRGERRGGKERVREMEMVREMKREQYIQEIKRQRKKIQMAWAWQRVASCAM